MRATSLLNLKTKARKKKEVKNRLKIAMKCFCLNKEENLIKLLLFHAAYACLPTHLATAQRYNHSNSKTFAASNRVQTEE